MQPALPGTTSTPEARVESLAADLATTVVGFVAGRAYAFLGAMFLGIGGLVLTVGWQAGPQRALDARTFAQFTTRMPAQIVESWLAVEFDPAAMGKYPHWRPFAKASPCVVVEFATPWAAEPARRAFCGTRLTFAEHYTLHDMVEVAPGVPFSWQRDGRGFIAPELRLSGPAKEWLGRQSSTSYLIPSGTTAPTELVQLRRELDRPVDDALAGWARAKPELSVAFDPARPGEPLPAGFIDERLRRTPDWFLAAFGLGIGLVAWFAGIAMITGGLPRSVAWFVAIAPLVALPWWGEHFPRALRTMNADFASVIADMLGDVDPLGRLLASAPEDATLAQGERIAWRAGTGDYAGTFGRIAFALPQPRPADADAALLALNETVAAQMRGMGAQSRADIFDRLDEDKRAGRPRAGYAFLRAAKEALVAADNPPALRASANRFLETWVTQPVEEPWPSDLGFNARVELLRELTAIPPPNYIAIPASWIVERGDKRKAEAR